MGAEQQRLDNEVADMAGGGTSPLGSSYRHDVGSPPQLGSTIDVSLEQPLTRLLRPSILCLETGGTIASIPSPDGHRPATPLHEIIEQKVAQLSRQFDLAIPRLGEPGHFGKLIDSSNAAPEDWISLARSIQSQLTRNYSGIVVTSGTDTLAYLASALSVLLPELKVPVVITGAQRAWGEADSDAAQNLSDAVCAASALPGGVYVVFHHRIIAGHAVTKYSSVDLDAFRSVNIEDVGRIDSATIEFNSQASRRFIVWPAGPLSTFDNQVRVEHLVPGYDPRWLDDMLLSPDVHGVILLGYGLGGLPALGEKSLREIIELHSVEKPIIVMSQCPAGGTDLSQYEVGHQALKAGVIPGGKISLELATFLLKRILGQTRDVSEIRTLWAQTVQQLETDTHGIIEQ